MIATIRPTATPAATSPITFFQALFTSASGLASTTTPMGCAPLMIGAPTPMYVVLAPGGMNVYTGREDARLSEPGLRSGTTVFRLRAPGTGNSFGPE